MLLARYGMIHCSTTTGNYYSISRITYRGRDVMMMPQKRMKWSILNSRGGGSIRGGYIVSFLRECSKLFYCQWS